MASDGRAGGGRGGALLAAIVPLAFAVFFGAVAVSFAVAGLGEEGLRLSVRTTARVSALLLAVTFSASPLQKLAAKPWSAWLLRARRQLGLSFAVVHLGHLGVVLALLGLHAESFWRTTAMTSVVGGAVGYVWIIAMTVTSFSGPRRKIGPKAWNVLHTSGMWVLWGIFVFSYVGRAFRQGLYAALLGMMLLALGLRIAARVAGRARKAA